MINSIFELLQVIINKELRGNLAPADYNRLAKQVQEEIFRGYFEDYRRDMAKSSRSRTGRNYANLPFVQRQRIDQFSKSATLTFNTPIFTLPTDLYLVKDNGIDSTGIVVNEIEGNKIAYLQNTLSGPSSSFPVYERIANTIQVYPTTIVTGITCRYLRQPLDPNWTYTVVSGAALFNVSDADYQDFELHVSEYNNIVIRILSYLGINIREAEVTQYAEALKDKAQVREES